MDVVYRMSRYNKGEAAYLNCPMNEQEYKAFREALCEAEMAPVHGFENKKVFEGCMPIEVMAARGEDTMRFGPMKPVGLPDPRTGKDPYAVVQLRQDNEEDSMYNIVGFQTHLKWGEQKRVFGMIPGLSHAEFIRYGVMHRNTYIDSPDLLDATMESRKQRGLFFAGQMIRYRGSVCGGGPFSRKGAEGISERNGDRCALSLYFPFRGKEFPTDECEFRPHPAA